MKFVKYFLILSLLVVFGLSGLFAAAKYEDNSKVENVYPLQINSWKLNLTNFGIHGHDPAGYPGGEWPIGTGHMYIYGAGLWIGGIVNGEKHVAVGYNPNNGQSEMKPGFIGTNPTDQQWKIYTSDDLSSWPVRDAEGNPIVKSILDTYCEMNDGGEMGINIVQKTYAWNYPSNKDIVFVIYEISAASSTIDSVYLAVTCDPDLGAAQNDMIGFDPERNITYVYNSTPDDSNFGDAITGIAGYDFLESPVDPATGEQLGMTSMTIFTLENDPNTDDERYNLMEGLDPQGNPRPYGPYDYDNSPDDKRFMQATGPFTLVPGDEPKRIVIAIVAGNGTEGREDFVTPAGITIPVPTADCLADIYKHDDAAQAIYDNNWLLPNAPVPPHVDGTALDGMNVITWDNYSEITPDPYYQVCKDSLIPDPQNPDSLIPNGLYDPTYREYDFEGYILYRSEAGVSGPWTQIGKWDKNNGITIFPDTTYNPDINGNEIVAMHIGDDTGLKYYYLDTDVQNYFKYYYAVTAYDYQDSKPRSLECGKTQSTVILVPQPAANGTQNNASVDPDSLIVHEGPGDGFIKVKVIDPTKVTGDDYKVLFDTDDNGNVYWMLKDVTKDTLVLDKQYHQADPDSYESDDEFLIVDGIQVKVMGPPPEVKSVVELDANGDIYDSNVWGSLNNYGRSQHWPTFLVMEARTSSSDNLTFDNLDRLGQMPPNDYIFKFVPQEEGTLVWEYYDDHLITDADGNPLRVPVQVWMITPDGTEKRLPICLHDANENGVWERNIPGCKYYGLDAYNIAWEYFVVYDNVEYKPEDEADYISAGDGTVSPGYGPWGVRYPTMFYVSFNMYADIDEYATPDQLDDDGFFKVPPHEGEVIKFITTKPLSSMDSFAFSTTANNAFDPTLAEKDMDKIKVVPNPFLVRTQWDISPDNLHLLFTHLPETCTIKIYTIAGNLIWEKEHTSGNTEYWNLLTKDDQIPASGVYIYRVESKYGTKLGKFAIIR